MSIIAATALENPWIEALSKQAYLNLQWGKGYFSVAHKTFFNRLKHLVHATVESETVELEASLVEQLQVRMEKLLEQDWADAKAGVYPLELLFEESWEAWTQFYLPMCLDIPTTWTRAIEKRHQEFSHEVETSGYPDYYLQTFHNQTDGYLSETSANFYDLQVDLLFGGKADAMRRRILGPLKRSLHEAFGNGNHGNPTANISLSSEPLHIVDLACGTGRTLKQLRQTFPQAHLQGLDLSPTYIQKAEQNLAQLTGLVPQLAQGNAEHCPYKDEQFHGVVSVFLFHELPPQARQRVLEESFRILKPGGCLVICDSIQLKDSVDFSPMMQNFSTLFHEPYYQSYIRDDLEDRLRTVGYQTLDTEIHFFSKYWIARKG